MTRFVTFLDKNLSLCLDSNSLPPKQAYQFNMPTAKGYNMNYVNEELEWEARGKHQLMPNECNNSLLIPEKDVINTDASSFSVAWRQNMVPHF